MPAKGLLNWLDGNGWLVMSGGDTPGSPLRAQALTRIHADGVVIYISLADDEGEALQEDMEDLGAPVGYIVNIEDEEPESLMKHLKEASLIVIESGENIDSLYWLLKDAAVEGLRTAYERGAMILIEGLAVNLFGRWIMSDGGEILPGLDWLQSAFIEPGVTGAGESRAVQAVFAEFPEAIAVEIGEGSALCLGGNDSLETWGEKQVTISLGSAYQND
jgi:hypothetical protein